MYEVSGYPVAIRPIEIPDNFREPDFDIDAWIAALKRESDEWIAQLEEEDRIANEEYTTHHLGLPYEGD